MAGMEGYFGRGERLSDVGDDEYNWNVEHEDYYQRRGKYNLPPNSTKKIPSRCFMVKPPAQPSVESEEDQGNIISIPELCLNLRPLASLVVYMSASYADRSTEKIA